MFTRNTRLVVLLLVAVIVLIRKPHPDYNQDHFNSFVAAINSVRLAA